MAIAHTRTAKGGVGVSPTPPFSKHWRLEPACTSYQTYIRPWPIIPQQQHEALITALQKLGMIETNEVWHTTTIRGPWGFMIVPPAGFPELKVYSHTSARGVGGGTTSPKQDLLRVLAYVDQQIANCK